MNMEEPSGNYLNYTEKNKILNSGRLEAVSFRRIATVEQLQLEQTDRQTQLYRIPRAATP